MVSCELARPVSWERCARHVSACIAGTRPPSRTKGRPRLSACRSRVIQPGKFRFRSDRIAKPAFLLQAEYDESNGFGRLRLLDAAKRGELKIRVSLVRFRPWALLIHVIQFPRPCLVANDGRLPREIEEPCVARWVRTGSRSESFLNPSFRSGPTRPRYRSGKSIDSSIAPTNE
jgi:hypothetical protein